MLTIKPESFQTHSALSGWRAVLKLYEYTGERKYLDAVVKIADTVVAGNQIATHAVWNDINQESYCEGCGAADWFLLNYELWQLTGDAAYLDRAETVLYSALYYMQEARGGFSCTGHKATGCLWPQISDGWWCCNQKCAIALCKAVQSCLAADDAGVYVTFFMPLRATLSVKGKPVELQMETDYPNTGKIALKVIRAPDDELRLRVRVPAWSALESVSLNHQAVKQKPAGGFLVVKRRWLPRRHPGGCPGDEAAHPERRVRPRRRRREARGRGRRETGRGGIALLGTGHARPEVRGEAGKTLHAGRAVDPRARSEIGTAARCGARSVGEDRLFHPQCAPQGLGVQGGIPAAVQEKAGA